MATTCLVLIYILLLGLDTLLGTRVHSSKYNFMVEHPYDEKVTTIFMPPVTVHHHVEPILLPVKKATPTFNGNKFQPSLFNHKIHTFKTPSTHMGPSKHAAPSTHKGPLVTFAKDHPSLNPYLIRKLSFKNGKLIGVNDHTGIQDQWQYIKGNNQNANMNFMQDVIMDKALHANPNDRSTQPNNIGVQASFITNDNRVVDGRQKGINVGPDAVNTNNEIIVDTAVVKTKPFDASVSDITVDLSNNINNGLAGVVSATVGEVISGQKQNNMIESGAATDVVNTNIANGITGTSTNVLDLTANVGANDNVHNSIVPLNNVLNTNIANGIADGLQREVGIRKGGVLVNNKNQDANSHLRIPSDIIKNENLKEKVLIHDALFLQMLASLKGGIAKVSKNDILSKGTPGDIHSHGKTHTTNTAANNGVPTVNDLSKIIHLKDMYNTLIHQSGTPDSSIDRHNPLPFMVNIEPFGPGPYGECREPSRVVCGARLGWNDVTGMADWCATNCVVYSYSSYCDDERCTCRCTG